MADITKDQLVLVILRTLPYAEQMRDLDTVTEPEAIRFMWRNDRFRVSITGHASTLEGYMEVGGNLAILMQALVQRGMIQLMDEQAKVPAKTQ